MSYSGAIKISNVNDLLSDPNCTISNEPNLIKSDSNESAIVSVSDCLACSGCVDDVTSSFLSMSNFSNSAFSNLADAFTNIMPPIVLSIHPLCEIDLMRSFNHSLDFRQYLWRNIHPSYIFSMDMAYLTFLKKLESIETESNHIYSSHCPGWTAYAIGNEIFDTKNYVKTFTAEYIQHSLVTRFMTSKNISIFKHFIVCPCYDKKFENVLTPFYNLDFTTPIDLLKLDQNINHTIPKNSGSDESLFLNLYDDNVSDILRPPSRSYGHVFPSDGHLGVTFKKKLNGLRAISILRLEKKKSVNHPHVPTDVAACASGCLNGGGLTRRITNPLSIDDDEVEKRFAYWEHVSSTNSEFKSLIDEIYETNRDLSKFIEKAGMENTNLVSVAKNCLFHVLMHLFQVGEEILAKSLIITSEPRWFKAKIIDKKIVSNEISFYVHYHKLNRRHDVWLNLSDITLTTDNSVSVMTDDEIRQIEDDNDHEGMKDADVLAWEKATKLKRINTLKIHAHDESVTTSIPTWYWSPIPIVNTDESSTYICHKCLYFFSREIDLNCHRHTHCLSNFTPPGFIVYDGRKSENFKDPVLLLYEVDGYTSGNSANQNGYASRLCLLSKLFLDHKRYENFEVAKFLFYPLYLYYPSRKYLQFVGYYSKEKFTTKYILSCIMVLPCYQRKGYGNFLIRVSYEVAKRMRISGGPERPLSDLGKSIYIKYWSSEIRRYLQYCIKESLFLTDGNNKFDFQNIDVFIKEVSKFTNISTSDLEYCIRKIREKSSLENVAFFEQTKKQGIESMNLFEIALLNVPPYLYEIRE